MVLKSTGQLNVVGMGGTVGLNFPAVFSLADALDYNRRTLAELLPWAERGLVVAINTKDGENDGEV